MVTLIEHADLRPSDARRSDAVAPPRAKRRRLRRTVQIVFQNPYGSLNPRKKIGTILEEPLVINTELSQAERRERARAMMAKVGLRPEHYDRYPHMFSGGQRQRIAIARALMLSPQVVVADEPVSALDVSIQAQVLNLLVDLQDELDLAYLFISHDLGVVRHIADDVMVMYLGRAIEHGPKEPIFARPLHPYTQALLASTPRVAAAKRRAHRAARRTAVAAQSADGLRVLDPLPLCDRSLPGRAPGEARDGWPAGRLPLRRGLPRQGGVTALLRRALPKRSPAR